jgi:hypothetical protein
LKEREVPTKEFRTKSIGYVGVIKALAISRKRKPPMLK